MLNSWCVVALPYAGRKTIHQDNQQVGGELTELEEWCLWHSLSYRCRAGQSGTSDRPSLLFRNKNHRLMCVCWLWFSLVEVFHSHCLTFSGRHVDASAITAQWVWPPKGPGHVIEHRVVGPAEAAVVFVGVEPQPPVVSLHFWHLKVKRTEYWKGMSRP